MKQMANRTNVSVEARARTSSCALSCSEVTVTTVQTLKRIDKKPTHIHIMRTRSKNPATIIKNKRTNITTHIRRCKQIDIRQYFPITMTHESHNSSMHHNRMTTTIETHTPPHRKCMRKKKKVHNNKYITCDKHTMFFRSKLDARNGCKPYDNISRISA